MRFLWRRLPRYLPIPNSTICFLNNHRQIALAVFAEDKPTPVVWRGVDRPAFQNPLPRPFPLDCTLHGLNLLFLCRFQSRRQYSAHHTTIGNSRYVICRFLSALRVQQCGRGDGRFPHGAFPAQFYADFGSLHALAVLCSLRGVGRSRSVAAE